MATYVISDLHSCYTKFKSTIPGDTRKLILNGDLFNKGREQVEMFAWLMKNHNNPRYIFIRGNTEVRLHNELVRHFEPQNTSAYYQWLGTNTGYKNRNITNVVIELINRGRYKLEDVFDCLRNSYKWYHIENDWIIAHASWQLNKSPATQSQLNLVYDNDNLLAKVKKKNSEVTVPKMYDKFNFIFGHTPIYNFSREPVPPVIFLDRFYYIDNGIFKTSRPIFYMKIA